MPSNLSLGKLKRAVDGTDSYTTANTSLAAQNDGSSQTAMSDFACGTIGSLSISDAGPGTSASGTATLNFSGQGSLFNTKIRNRSENFGWSETDTPGALSLTTPADYNTSYTIGGGAPVTTGIQIKVKFREDGQSDGFNSEAQYYNSDRIATYAHVGGA
jgi:hypothetical protein|tara:strand:- start:555 stop:1031 length:477 start_codon:yes stop_codon:yes gene_type:complete